MEKKIDFTSVFASRTISFNTIMMLVVYIISRVWPDVQLNAEDIVVLQTFGNILLRYVTSKPIVGKGVQDGENK